MLKQLFFFILLVFFACNNTGGEDSEQVQSFSSQNKTSIPCFVYHRFGEPDLPSTNISISVFRQQLEYLRQHDYQVLTIGELDEFYRSDSTFENVAVLTVDDGYKSFIENAMPLLEEFGYSATIFINTESIGSSGYLNWSEIDQLKESGIEIGNHSHSHAHFINQNGEVNLDNFRSDTERAQDLFKEEIALVPAVYAYPYGEFVPAMHEVLKDLGFESATAQKSGVISNQSDFYELPRFPMGGPYATLEGFISKIKMKPLIISSVEPVSPVIESNPPKLTVAIADFDQYQGDAIQCFIGGEQVNLTTISAGKYEVTAPQPLNSRRTLYTITIPDQKGNWYWYSHLWINPRIPE